MPDILSEARRYREFGLSVAPLGENSKVPPKGFLWKPFQERVATPEEIDSWFANTRLNIGIVCGEISGGLFVKDFDSKEKAREFYKANKPILRTVVETRRGAHFYFRGNAPTSQGDKEDGRGEGSFVVAPPSLVSNWLYRFVEGHGLVPPEELCELPIEMNKKSTIDKIGNGGGNKMDGMTDKMAVKMTAAGDKTINDVWAYIRAIKSIQGQRGSDACFRVACVLRDAGFSEAETLEELIAWNVVCASPAWSLRELAKKAKDVFTKR